MHQRRAACWWCLTLLCLLLPAPLFGQNQLINGGLTVVGPINGCDDTGSTDAYACNHEPAITEYNTKVVYIFRANTANTGPATINFNGVGAVPITKVQGAITTPLVDNDIRAGQLVMVAYDGVQMQMVSPVGNAVGPAQQLSAATGTVAALACSTVELYYRHDISGPLTIPAMTGTCVDGQKVVFRLKPQTSVQTLSFTAGASKAFSADGGLALPTATADNATYVEHAFVYNSFSDRFAYAGGNDPTAPCALADGCTGVALSDPGAHRLWGWDDTDNAIKFWLLGPGLTYTPANDTLSVERLVTVELVPDATALTTGDGKYYFPVNAALDGYSVVSASAHLGAVNSSAGVVTVDIDRCAAVATGIRCSGTNVSIFTTLLTVDATEDGSETAAAAAAVNATNAVLATGQHLRFNIDTIGTGTQGLQVTLVLRRL